MAGLLDTNLRELSDVQRKAVEWDDGPLLVLAGPGSGKTRVLTCRVARILNRSPDERFRVLALTFTNKAAHEMSSRVADLVPDLVERSYIDTFHGFCARVLRQHGTHLDIKSDFAIYSQTSDRRAVLEDALRSDLDNCSEGSDGHVSSRIDMLQLIDILKTRLVSPEQSESWLTEDNAVSRETARRAARVYRLYEDELRHANALDFNSLIFEAYKLFAYPVIARHYQIVYRYWLIDEFQDTNWAQYQLLRRVAGDDFRQVFAVADDDQTIYEWNGADVRRISTLVKDFGCDVVQLPTNYRCPPQIVETANRLIVYNARHHGLKRPTESVSRHPASLGQQIQCRLFETDKDETAGIAAEIAQQDGTSRSRTLVIARTRALLEPMIKALTEQSVPTKVLMRRDDFATPQLRWLVACLKQIHRPLDQHNMATLVKTFNSFAAKPLYLDDLVPRAAAKGAGYLTVWTDAARAAGLPKLEAEVVDMISALASDRMKFNAATQRILELFQTANSGDEDNKGEDSENEDFQTANNEDEENKDSGDEDFKDDLSAWQRLSSEIISSQRGSVPLDRFLQELELRSKEPVSSPGAVSLATIHSVKGLESDTVYLIGLAEEVLPSWHSINKSNGGTALEEERRCCFVAITRTKKQLILSRARHYRGWPKQPSRFLTEMRLLNGANDKS